MADTATSPDIRARASRSRDAVELVSSMRFAIALLTVICIASVIGTVVKQNEPINNYVNQFGPFWSEVFGTVGLYSVYSAWWFLLILAFLVVSTSLCIARNAPKIVADLRTYKEHLREQSLAAFHHKAQGHLDEAPADALARISALLVGTGWKAKVETRPHGTMVAARRGGGNKLGYIAAHGAIVLVCLGGLFDGDLIVRAQMALQGKSIYTGGGMLRDVPAAHRLGPATPTFRANLPVAEGQVASTAIINMKDGVVLQELPFDVELKKFIVEYYATGMPKLFASEIAIRDHATNEVTAATVKVNEPVFHRGVAIYQSSFDDGGSALTLRALPLRGGQPFDVSGVVGGSTELVARNAAGDQRLTLEFTGLRVINVENLGDTSGGADGATDVRKVDLVGSLREHLGSGAKGKADKGLRNVGPAITYKLRDASGQAREFHNYMLPVELEGRRVFLAGLREAPSEPFRYLRIPADENDAMDGWLRLRAGLLDAAQRDEAVRRYAAHSVPRDNRELAEQILATARRGMALFAGAETTAGKAAEPPVGGLQAVADFVEANVPEADRPRISEVLLRILNGSLFELYNLTRERAGLKHAEPDEAAQAFMTQAVLSMSDSFHYPAPVLMQLTDFKQVQASVFQVARAPGKTLVYLGSTLLIIGVFAMLYIRERRLWIWLQPAGAGTEVTTALSTTRRTIDADAEFDRLRQAILQETS
jgi:cytochrome c biogenesis protein